MSTKLVRKLLQQTANVASVETKHAKKRKRPEGSILSPEEMMKHHLQHVLQLDEAISKRPELRKKKQRRQPSRKHSTATAATTIGNSRSSSHQAATRANLPTVRKYAYRREQKKQTLEKIAKLLDKAKQKQSKPDKSK